LRPLRYSVAASLDGYIAGPDGEFDWIVVDPDIDFAAIIPVVLGGGLPLMPTPGPRLKLRLRSHRVYQATGTIFLEYDVVR
jgi:dihydrofolate reductase